MIKIPPYPFNQAEAVRTRYHEQMRRFLLDYYALKSEVVSSRTSTEVSGDVTLTDDDDIVLCDTLAGAITVTLPDATTVDKKSYVIKLTADSANAVTVESNGGTIDKTTTATLQYLESVELYSDGTNWWIIA